MQWHETEKGKLHKSECSRKKGIIIRKLHNTDDECEETKIEWRGYKINQRAKSQQGAKRSHE